MGRVKVVCAGALAVFAVTHSHAIVAAAHSAAAPIAARQHATVTSARVTGGTKDCAQLERLWDAAGGNPSHAFMAAEIATAESGGQQDPPSNAGLNANGKTDVGYWQINSGYWPALATTDPLGNARAAVKISSDGTDWTPWVTFDNNLYQGKC